MSEGVLSPFFRKLNIDEKREQLAKVFGLSADECEANNGSLLQNELSDLMVESSIGIMPVPLGIVTGLPVDGKDITVPLAVEEPSVIAAATYAGRILKIGTNNGGIKTWASEPVMRAQISLSDVPVGGEAAIRSAEDVVRSKLASIQERLIARGGGFRGLSVRRLSDSDLVVVDILIDVRDAMGANLLNTAAEEIKVTIERVSGGKTLMAILTNSAEDRRAGASFSLPIDKLSKVVPAGMTAIGAANRIVLASHLAQEDPSRAVTHNKGIMNGISALALATGNDTRAVEAAAHSWAARSGSPKGLSEFYILDGALCGRLELPLALGTVGGAINIHPAAGASLKILGNPDSMGLARIAAALGLAQNFAALLALVTGGIQKGHMKLHAGRLAYQSGARGEEVRLVAEGLSKTGSFTLKDAEQELVSLRGKM
jgi:hydroxymethylglutaryl-CoA reductase